MVYRDTILYDSSGYAVPVRRSVKPSPRTATAPSYTVRRDIARSDALLIARAKGYASRQETTRYARNAGADFYLGVTRGESRQEKHRQFLVEERGRPIGRDQRSGSGLGFLDTPYNLVSEKGGALAEKLASKSIEYKEKGSHAKGLAYAIGASTVAFGTGVLAGITGLISPKAWRETYTAITHPKKTVKTIATNPLSWSYLAGTIIGPSKLLGMAKGRVATIREPDPVFAKVKYSSIEGKALYNYPREGEFRWLVRGEEIGITREVGKGLLDTPKKRTLLLSKDDKLILMIEERSGLIRSKVTRRYAILEQGKETYAREIYEFDWRGKRYKYRVEIYDPLKTGLVAKTRQQRLFDISLFESPPRITRAPPLDIAGAVLGAGIGAGMTTRTNHSKKTVISTRQHPLIVYGGSSSPVLSIASKSRTISKSSGKQLVGSRIMTIDRNQSLLPGFNNKVYKSKRPRRRRGYSEIVYPSLSLVF